MKSIIPFCLFLTALLIFSGVSAATDPFLSEGGLKKFSSLQEIKDYLKQNQVNQYPIDYELSVRDIGPPPAIPVVPQVASLPAPMTTQSAEVSGTGSNAYSSTNIQVKGVDEADIVKNDGKYIYIVSGDKIVTVDAYPGKNASIISTIDSPGTPYEIYMKDDRLVLFRDSYEKETSPIYPLHAGIQAVTYNISDRKKPIIVNNISIDGSYLDSRRIGDIVYMITQEYINPYSDSDIILPSIRVGNKTVATPDVYYFDNPEYQYVFHTVTSFNMSTGKEIDSKTFLMGSTNTLYVSQNNIYLGYEKYRQSLWLNPLIITDISPLVLSETRDSIIKSNNSANLTNKKVTPQITRAVKVLPSATVTSPAEEFTKTVIHRIAIGNGTIGYGGKGEIEGRLLNQFSLDEYNSTIRLATTVDPYSSESFNNVLILNKSMKKIGEITHVAPGEKIYSTRFMGERLYMVTFKQMDPFFVIDLSDPTKPKVLGELKIPGYSDYLHPYDENHIIGIGKETQQNEKGGYRPKGLKLALFDVTNATRPKMIDKYEIGLVGSSSPALDDHKAFLFNKEKDLLAIPVHEITSTGDSNNYYDEKAWNGVYVFSLTPEDGFKLRGRIPFNSNGDNEVYSYCTSDNAKRSLYINETFYTISLKLLKISPLENVNYVIKTIKLPYDNPCYWIY